MSPLLKYFLNGILDLTGADDEVSFFVEEQQVASPPAVVESPVTTRSNLDFFDGGEESSRERVIFEEVVGDSPFDFVFLEEEEPSSPAATSVEERNSALSFFVGDQCSKELVDRLLFEEIVSGSTISFVAEDKVVEARSSGAAPPREELNYALAFYPEPQEPPAKLLDDFWLDLDTIAELDEDACCSRDYVYAELAGDETEDSSTSDDDSNPARADEAEEDVKGNDGGGDSIIVKDAKEEAPAPRAAGDATGAASTLKTRHDPPVIVSDPLPGCHNIAPHRNSSTSCFRGMWKRPTRIFRRRSKRNRVAFL